MLLSVVLHTTAVAQVADPDVPPSSGTVLQGIVITALKRQETDRNVPFGLSVISGSDLEDRKAERVEGVVRNVPNMGFIGFGDGRSTNFNIRGVGAVGDPLAPGDTSVVVYVDGVPQPIFATDMSFFDLDSVEVLKGPQGTLFGRNAMGGAILINTRKPTDQKQVRIRQEVGDPGEHITEAIASGPIRKGKASGRLALRYSGIDGFVPNVITGSDAGQRDVVAGRGTLHLTPNSKTEATLSVNFDNEDRTFPFFPFRGTANFPTVATILDDRMKRDFKGSVPDG